MRLYRTPSGRWFGTQADARSACLDEAVPSKAWTEIDVPTDKPGLLDWLHLNCGPATVEAARAERELDDLYHRASEAGGKSISVVSGGRPISLASDDETIWRRVTVVPFPSEAPPAPRDMSATAHLSRMANPGIDIDAMIEAIATAELHSLKRYAGAVAVRFGELAK